MGTYVEYEFEMKGAADVLRKAVAALESITLKYDASYEACIRWGDLPIISDDTKIASFWFCCDRWYVSEEVCEALLASTVGEPQFQILMSDSIDDGYFSTSLRKYSKGKSQILGIWQCAVEFEEARTLYSLETKSSATTIVSAAEYIQRIADERCNGQSDSNWGLESASATAHETAIAIWRGLQRRPALKNNPRVTDALAELYAPLLWVDQEVGRENGGSDMFCALLVMCEKAALEVSTRKAVKASAPRRL